MRTETPDLMVDNSQTSGDSAERASARPVYRPRVDILDTKDAVVLLADMPGVAEDSADVTLDKNVLTIRGSVTVPDEPGLQELATEYGIGDFERVFTLTDQIDRSEIAATMKDGVLRVRLPKAQEAASRRISVKSG
jgi:HSP20 family protein